MTGDPNLADSLSALASQRASAGDMASAMSLLRRAAALDPVPWTTWHSLATLYRAQPGAPSALASQRRAYALGATGPLCMLQLAILEALGGSADAARTHLAAALDAAPDLAKHVPNDVVMATVRSGRFLESAMLAEDLVARLPGLDGAPEALHFTRARLARTASEVAAVVAGWGTSRDRALHPTDAERRRRAAGHVLIRGWGAGFWAEIFHVANVMAFAEITGRIPSVYWGEEVRYRGTAHANAWDQYFEPLSPVDRAELERAAVDVLPRSWKPETLFGSDPYRHIKALRGNPLGMGPLAALNRSESLIVADGFVDIGDVLAWTPEGHPWASMPTLDVFREIFARFRLKPEVNGIVSGLASKLLSGPTIAVHARSQSQGKNLEALEGREISLEMYFPQVDCWLEADPAAKLFILTDSEGAIAAFGERYGLARVVTLERARIPGAQDGYAGRALPRFSDVGFDMSIDGYGLGLEVLVDAYLAARCYRFIGDGASSVSCAVLNLKRWPNEDTYLIRQNVYLERRHWKTLA